MHRTITSIALTILFAALIGCGSSGPEIARVDGVVTLDGEPLPRATVIFVPPSGRPSAALTNGEGKYRLEFTAGRKGAIPGKNRVEITTYSPAWIDDDGKTIAATKERVPIQYNRETTLEFDVQPGKSNVADFELKSKGKIAIDQERY